MATSKSPTEPSPGRLESATSKESQLSRRKGEGGGKRRQGREMALQMLYQWDAGDTHPSEVLRAFDIRLYSAETAAGASSKQPADDEAMADAAAVPDAGDPASSERGRDEKQRQNIDRQVTVGMGVKARSKAYQFARTLLLGVVEHHQDLDEAIARRAENWRIERMPRVDRNILRMALYESKHQSELPKPVIIDEAIELAKRFGGEDSGSFVNGLLDGLLSVEASHRDASGAEASAQHDAERRCEGGDKNGLEQTSAPQTEAGTAEDDQRGKP